MNDKMVTDFYAMVLKPNMMETQSTEKSIHISMACLDVENADDVKKPVKVHIYKENTKYLICAFTNGNIQVNLDLNFKGGNVSFVVNGEHDVHLSGYCSLDNEDDNRRKDMSNINAILEKQFEDDLKMLLQKFPIMTSNSDEGGTSRESLRLVKQKNRRGIWIEDVKIGNGPSAELGLWVTVCCIGRTRDGERFYRRSSDNGSTFRLGDKNFMKAWNMGIPGMRPGGIRRIKTTPRFKNGSNDGPLTVPSGRTIDYEMHLIRVR